MLNLGLMTITLVPAYCWGVKIEIGIAIGVEPTWNEPPTEASKTIATPIPIAISIWIWKRERSPNQRIQATRK